MAKITLGATPKNFKKTVKNKILDENGKVVEGTIDCSFIYRTTTEYGKLVDELNEGQPIRQADDGFFLADLLRNKKERNGEYIVKILDGWGMDAEFNVSNAQQLCDEYPGVAEAIFTAYREAIVEGRLGN